MIYTRTEMKAKAIEILERLHVSKELIRDYKESDKVPFFSNGYAGYENFVKEFFKDHKSGMFSHYGECYAVILDKIYGCFMLSFGGRFIARWIKGG